MRLVGVGWFVAVIAGAACRRAPVAGSTDAATDGPARIGQVEGGVTQAGAMPPAAPSAQASASYTPSGSLPVAPAPSGEAKRTTLPSLDRSPLPRAETERLRLHFGDRARGPFALQEVGRTGGGQGVLVSRADESDPIVLCLGPEGPAFVREHPTAGITPPVQHPTLAPGPERGLAMFSYVPSEKLVAARMWADDGNPFAEIVVFRADRCDALAVAYGDGWGWVVACTSPTGTRAQRLRPDLTPAWGAEGAVVGFVGPVERPAIRLDDAFGFTLTQRAKAVGGDRTLTFRYDRDAQPLPAL